MYLFALKLATGARHARARPPVASWSASCATSRTASTSCWPPSTRPCERMADHWKDVRLLPLPGPPRRPGRGPGGRAQAQGDLLRAHRRLRGGGDEARPDRAAGRAHAGGGAAATDSPVLDKVLSNISEVRARGAHVLAVATEGSTEVAEHAEEVVYVPRTDWLLQPLLAVIPLQLLAYYIAQRTRAERGPAAQPREDRHGRVTSMRRARPARDRAARAGAGTPARAWPSACSPTPSAPTPPPRPARPSTWPPASAPRRPWPRRWRWTGWSFTDVEVVATGGAPDVRLSGGAGARADELGVRVRVSLTHTDTTAGAVAAGRCEPLPGLAGPAVRGGGDARGGRLGDRAAGRAVAGPDGARGGGAGPRQRRRGRPGPGAGRGGQGQQRRRRPGGGAAAARGGPRGGRAGRRRPGRARGRRAGQPGRACPATRRRPFAADGPGGLGRGAWTPCWAPASRASRASRWPRPSPRSTPSRRPVVACDVPSGVDATTGRGARARRCAPR